MVKRTAPIRIISFLLLAACGALCQKRPPPELLQGLRFAESTSPEDQRPKMRASKSLPDAPSAVQPPTPQQFHLIRETELRHVTHGPQPSPTTLYELAFIQGGSGAVFGKYFRPASPRQEPSYYASTSGSFLGRATFAASRILITRDDYGEKKLNASFFLKVLSSVAIDTAYRPYWTRSTSGTFKTFGSTIGSGVGINLFHEFGPGIRQIVKVHTPKFVSRITQ